MPTINRSLPNLGELLALAELPEMAPRVVNRMDSNRVIFPIFTDAQIDHLTALIEKNRITPVRYDWSRDGIIVDFETADEAVLTKMAFNCA